MSKITHVAGNFIIQADGAFLNGAGLSDGVNRNVTVPKSLRVGNNRYPYVSAQSWRRWLRNTVCEEAGWQPSELRTIKSSEKGSSSKISGGLNPIDFPEDDIFGYMRSAEGQGKVKESLIPEDEGEENDDMPTKTASKSKVKALIRTSPFMSSILISIRNNCITKDDGFVHLKEGSPLPYSTEFYYTDLQGVFCLDYSRLGKFANIGDKIELDELLLKREDIIVNDGIYELKNRDIIRKERASSLLKALAVLRGGAKMAAFGGDVSPKVIVAAGLSCGNPIFNNVFVEDGAKVKINIELLKELAFDYKDRLITKIFIGVRTGYLSNENDLELLNKEFFEVTTPLKAMEKLSGEL